jgi:1-deoxy-D-xylulose-5-phosphate reductoisomerase
LKLARHAGEEGGCYPAVLNAANEVAVEAFCNRTIPFTAISEIVARTMEGQVWDSKPNLEQILAADGKARAFATACVERLAVSV